MKIVILAAGKGLRLGVEAPKPLTQLKDGRSILGRQIDLLRTEFGVTPVVVVGYKKELVMEAFPSVGFVYNERFSVTNTAKSLGRAMRVVGCDSILVLNGDVVFEPSVARCLADAIREDASFVCVNRSEVGEEEVKYRLGADGYIASLSKKVEDAAGEAVGINYIAARDWEAIMDRLDDCSDDAYFEAGIEAAISDDNVKVIPLDLGDKFCVEIDFEEDLEHANMVLEAG